MKNLLLLSLFLLNGLACFPQSGDNVSFSLFLIGNAGKYNKTDSNHTRFLQTILNYRQNKKGIIFLGNNAYPGLSDILSGDPEDLHVDLRLDSLRQFDGPICFVPGWADWAYGTSNGKEMIKWEYKTIHKQLENQEVYMPDQACPGPLEVPVNDSLTIILLDTQWWLHPYDTRFGKCDLEEESEVWLNLRDVLRRNRNKQVVVAGYHPVVSYGEYGGYYPALTKVIGFPVFLYRKYLGTRLDLAHPAYKAMRTELQAILEDFPNVIYASSHEKNFQYISEKNVHYIIGGSLEGGRYLEEKKLVCGSRESGYSRLDFYRDGRVELLFFSLDEPDQPLCHDLLYTYKPKVSREERRAFASASDSLPHAPSNQYIASPSARKWMGENYRDVWGTPIRAEWFDIEKEQGGLKIIRRGGGQQTRSVRLEASNGQQYALRSMEKFVEGALPDEVRNTIAVKVVQDNISASNPYAALPVAKLAATAGIFHTNPKVVYVPHDYRLGEYMEDLAGDLFLFEERPSGNWSEQASFGFSSKIEGTDDVVENTQSSPGYQVDQQAVLKARLFDTFINDWDRHDDQWRWASFKENGTRIYRPIPRDRDQAFYVNEGILPKMITRKWLLPKFQGFAPLTPNMEGLVFNARYFDRTFLTAPDWFQWKQTVDTLQALLTDRHIGKAMEAFPEEVQALVSEKTAEILKQRRDNLGLMAREHYLLLAENVNVTGTDKDDFFELVRINDQETKVSVYARSKQQNQKKPWYQRIFTTGETREIRLYGLGGDDYFRLSGTVDSGIKVRVIGGKGKDSIISQSTVNVPGKQTVVYDLKKNTGLTGNEDTRNHLAKNKMVNHYDRMDFHPNVVSPGLFMGYNQDDGMFIGGGPVFNHYRFRRHNAHAVMANFATLTSAFNVKYTFDSESLVTGFDHHFGFELKAPDYVLNYFGMGNGSEKDERFNDRYYRLRANQLILDYGLGRRWGKTAFKQSRDGSVNQHELVLGVFMKRSNIEERPDDFIANLPNNGLDGNDLDRQLFAGFYGRYDWSNLDDEVNPERGLRFSLGGRQFYSPDNNQDHFLRLTADVRTYISFTKDPRAVLAFRLGGAAVFGDYAFLEAAKLGGKSNLRGYLADRFYGDQSFYQNMELRVKLIDFSSYLLNGELGFLSFYDAGRVWFENENSDRWHKGYGAGFWVSPFEMTIFTATYNWSKDDRMAQVSLNFKF